MPKTEKFKWDILGDFHFSDNVCIADAFLKPLLEAWKLQ